MLDYAMSKEFGLDWQEYDSVRIETIMEVMHAKNERERKENDKVVSKNKKNRGR